MKAGRDMPRRKERTRLEGRKKRFTARRLEEGIDRYFASIRRTVVATERVETGPKTFEEKPIISDAGEPIRCREYVVAPTLWGLCEALGITPAEWNRLSDRTCHPELQGAVQRAYGLMREWKEQSLLTRKDVRGLIYHMQNHLGGLELPAESEEPPLTLGEKGELLFADTDEEAD